MMGRIACSLLCLAGATVAFVPTSARAQCRLCGEPAIAADGGAQSEEVRLEVEAGLDFDRLILTGPGEGSATLRPDGTRLVSGTIGSMSGRAMVGEARVRGLPGRPVRIDLPRRIDLYSVSGARISIDEVTTDLPHSPRLDSAGNLKFRFGGRLRVHGDAEGEFRGDLPLTVEYL